MRNEKLKQWALIAEIAGGAAIIISLVFLILEIRNNTEATYAANRQSIATRTEQLLIARATSPHLAEIEGKLRAGEELSSQELSMHVDQLAAFLRLAEESYLLYRDGQLSEEYWNTRASNLVGYRLRPQYARESWMNSWSQSGWFTNDFSEWLTQALEKEYGK